jgi:hypothetical protein
MTAASLAFPGGRILTGWWRQLAPLRPLGLWIGHLLLHRVEALVCLQQHFRPDRLSRLLLQALSLNRSAPVSSRRPLQELEARLHLGSQILRRALHQLEREGLVQPDETAAWVLTPLGRASLEQEECIRTAHERRVFHFVQSEVPDHVPHFLRLMGPVTQPCPVNSSWQFDASLLDACVRRPREWKERHGFPPEVQEVLGLDQSSGVRNRGPLSEAWQRVILDRPVRLPAALVLTPVEGGGERLLGYAIRPDGWVLEVAQPIFNLGADWPTVFPELTVEPSPELWQQAWRAWCQPRGVPGPDIDRCTFQRQPGRLLVTAPTRLVQRLRSAKSEVFKGEVWLLAGGGRIRAAAQVELGEAKG